MVGWSVRVFTVFAMPALVLLAYTGFLLEGQFEALLGSASSQVMERPGAEERFVADVERLGGITQLGAVDETVQETTIRALVSTDAFREAVNEGQRRVGAAWDAGEAGTFSVDLTSSIVEADLGPDITETLLAAPIIESEPVDRPGIRFGQLGWLAVFAFSSVAALVAIVGSARGTLLYGLGLLAVYAPAYVWALHRMAASDDLASGAIGSWLQSRLSPGLYLVAAIGASCLFLARRGKSSESALILT